MSHLDQEALDAARNAQAHAPEGMMAKGEGDAVMRDKLFISDMILMLDGPEQREVQETARAAFDSLHERDG